jgi:hypothetical protein
MSLTFSPTYPAASFTPSTAWSNTVVATRFTRATGDCLRVLPPLRDDFRADDEDDLRAVEPRDDDFRALDPRVDDFLALEPLFRAEDFRALDDDDFRALDFRALDFRADEPRAPELLFRADVFLRADVPFRAEPPREDDFLDDEARELDPELRAPPDLLLEPPLRFRAPPDDPDRLLALFARPPLREPPLRFVLVAMLLLLMKEGVRDLMQNPRTERGPRHRACCIARLTRDSSGARGA